MDVTLTDCLRRMTLIFFGLFVPYFVISRTCKTRTQVQDMMASFSIICLVLGAVGIFESFRGWLLYAELPSRWGMASSGYLSRGGTIRAMASSGHPLTLGYLLAIGFGFWLYLQQLVQHRLTRFGVTALYFFGLIAAYSRGPWVGALLVYFSFAALGPRGFSKVLRATAGISALALLVALSPLAEKIARVVPYFGGTVDVGNIEYRERLFARSWDIITSQPIFGDQAALLKMEDLRQGEGIIDLINGFMNILLGDGFFGLTLILVFVLVGSAMTLRASFQTVSADSTLSKLGFSLVASLLGAMLLTWVGGLIELMFCILVGLMAAYIEVCHNIGFDHRQPSTPKLK